MSNGSCQPPRFFLGTARPVPRAGWVVSCQACTTCLFNIFSPFQYYKGIHHIIKVYKK